MNTAHVVGQGKTSTPAKHRFRLSEVASYCPPPSKIRQATAFGSVKDALADWGLL